MRSEVSNRPIGGLDALDPSNGLIVSPARGHFNTLENGILPVPKLMGLGEWRESDTLGLLPTSVLG